MSSHRKARVPRRRLTVATAAVLGLVSAGIGAGVDRANAFPLRPPGHVGPWNPGTMPPPTAPMPPAPAPVKTVCHTTIQEKTQWPLPTEYRTGGVVRLDRTGREGAGRAAAPVRADDVVTEWFTAPGKRYGTEWRISPVERISLTPGVGHFVNIAAR